MGINVLSISLDQQLAAVDKEGVFSGAQKRQLEYAKLVSKYFVVTRAYRGANLQPIQLSDSLYVFPTSSWNDYSFIYDAFRLGQGICDKEDIACISCADPFSAGLVGYLLKQSFGIPLNIHIMADLIDNPLFLNERFRYHLFNAFGKWLIQRADTIRVSTSREKKKLINDFDIDEKRVWNVPFFIDFEPYLQSEDKEVREQSLSGRFDRIILFAGRIVRQKDLSTLIKAIPLVIEEFPKSLFMIVGTGDQEKAVRRIVLDLGVQENVCWPGRISHYQIPAFFKACDVFAITSTYEGTCMVLQEAAISGKPIVATGFTGAYESIADGETGYIVPIGDSQQVASKILHLLKNPDLAAEMGAKGQKLVMQRFNEDKILQEYRRMWEATAGYK
ncbi:MAG: glycosyltransferase family 4 protein [Anaerolineae bacterium]